MLVAYQSGPQTKFGKDVNQAKEETLDDAYLEEFEFQFDMHERGDQGHMTYRSTPTSTLITWNLIYAIVLNFKPQADKIALRIPKLYSSVSMQDSPKNVRNMEHVPLIVNLIMMIASLRKA